MVMAQPSRFTAKSVVQRESGWGATWDWLAANLVKAGIMLAPFQFPTTTKHSQMYNGIGVDNTRRRGGKWQNCPRAQALEQGTRRQAVSRAGRRSSGKLTSQRCRKRTWTWTKTGEAGMARRGSRRNNSKESGGTASLLLLSSQSTK